jgi:hypothetical protein
MSKTFDVDVGGKTYEVDAPDANTAWRMANEYHQSKQQQAPAMAVNPTEDMSGIDLFSAGMGKAGVDIARGLGQAARGVLPEKLSNRIGLPTQADIDESRRLDEALMSTGSGMAGNIAGNVAAFLPTAAIPGVNTVVGGTALGAGMGLLQPVGTGDSRFANAAFGGITGVVVPAAVGGYRAARAALYDPFAGSDRIVGGVLTRAAGADAQQLAAQLRGGGQGAVTPGVNLSAGARTTSQGLNAIEDAIAAQLPSGELARSAQTNRTALANALRDIAGTPDEMAQLIAQREGAANALYGQAFQSDAMRRSLAQQQQQAAAGLGAAGGQVLPPDLATPGLRQLLNRPMFADAARQAQVLAANNGVMLGNPLESLQGLHYIKLALDDMSNPMAANALGRNEQAALGSMRDALANELAIISPTYGNARRTFQQMSEPINQRQVGEALTNRLVPATSGDVPASLNYASLARTMQDPDALARNATGFQGSQMARVLTPQQMTTVQGVTSDASRMAEALKRGAGTGSATARRLAQGDMIAQHITSEAPVVSRLLELSGQVPGLNMATRGISGLASLATSGQNARVLAQLDEMLATDPAGVARLVEQELARIPPTQRQQIIRNLPQSVLMAMPAIANAQQ